jgi:hypothetical protein
VVKTTLSCAALLVVGAVDPGQVFAQSDASTFIVPRPLVAIARRDLSFGTVLPGIPATVQTTDVRCSGLFEINGSKHEAVRVELLLPSALESAAGQELPIAFGPGDGDAATDRGRFHGVPFDPRQPLIATLGASGKLFVRLGGTALPLRTQADGTYRAAIILSIFDLGS